MRWKRVAGSGDIEDRRGEAEPGLAGQGGFPFPIPIGRAGGGGIGLLIVAAIVHLVAGGRLAGSGGGVSPIDPFPSAPGASGQGAVKGDDTTFEFAAYTRNELEPGDTDEALKAAAAVGDDRLQQQAGQRVNPESWTHGSSAERTRWFRKGFDSGDTRTPATRSPATSEAGRATLGPLTTRRTR